MLIIITMFGQVLRLGLIQIVPPNITAGVGSRASPGIYNNSVESFNTEVWTP